MNIRLLFSLATLLLTSAPVAGQENTKTSRDSGTTIAQIAQVAPDTMAVEKLAVKQTESDVTEQRAAVAEAKVELMDAAMSRLEIWIGIFGILITIMIALAGFFTWRSAANAARAEVQAMRDNLREIEKAAERTKAEIDRLASEATDHHGKILVISGAIEARANALPGDVNAAIPTKEQTAELTAVTKDIASRPEREWTDFEFRLMLLEAQAKNDWARYVELAEQMVGSQDAGEKERARATFSKAYGLAELGQHEQAARTYELYFNRYPEDVSENRASALSNWGSSLDYQARAQFEAGDYTKAQSLWSDAQKKYIAALAIDPRKHDALYNWGNALDEQARGQLNLGHLKTASTLFVESGLKYSAAIEIKPDHHDALVNWANSIGDQVRIVDESEKAEALWEAADAKYTAALAIKPESFDVHINWGSTLLSRASTKNSTERTEILARAEAHLEKANDIKPGTASYNLACLEGLRGNSQKAAQWLRDGAQKDKGFPSCSKIASDADLDLVRDSAEFKCALAEIGCLNNAPKSEEA